MDTKAKQLYALDDTTTADLLVRDTNGWEASAEGNSIRISAGKVEFKLGGTFGPGGAASGWTTAQVQSLAEGEAGTDTFIYAIQLGNGTLSWATATVSITGANDVATIGGDTTGSVTEDVAVLAGNLTAAGGLTITDPDPDHDQSAFVAQASVLGANGYGSFTLDADGHWTYAAGNNQAAIQQLNTGQSLTDSFVATSLDGGTSQIVTVTIQGANEFGILGTEFMDGLNLTLTPGLILDADALGDYDAMLLFGTPGGTVEIDLTATDQIVSIGGMAETRVQRNFENVQAYELIGSAVHVVGGAGAGVTGTRYNDVITLTGDIVGVHTGGGSDIITLNGNYASIGTFGASPIPGAESHTISVTGNNVYVQAGHGDNHITMDGGGYAFGGMGDDTMTLSLDSSYITGGGGSDVIHVEGDNNWIFGNFVAPTGSGTPAPNPGDLEFVLTGQNNRIYTGAGNHTITVNATYLLPSSSGNYVETGDGDNIVTLTGFNSYALLGGGADMVFIDGSNIQIHAGGGDDFIDVTGSAIMLWGDAGNDRFRFHTGSLAGNEIEDFLAGSDILELNGMTGPVSQVLQTGPHTGVRFYVGTESVFLRGLTAPLNPGEYEFT